jgi:alpha-beta hydrolase superfamily lysophospholipase
MAAAAGATSSAPERVLIDVPGFKGRKNLTIYPAADPKHAPSAVFIPGMRCHAGTYSTLASGGNFLAALAETGINVVAVDLPGHGRSEGPRGLFTYKSIIATLRAAVKYTAERFGTPVGVTGSSMGGILSLYAALEIPEVQAIVPINVLDLRNIDPALHLIRHSIVVPPTKLAARMGLGPLLTWMPIPVTAFLSTREVWEQKGHARAWLDDPFSVHAYRASAWISLFMDPSSKPALEEIKVPTRILVGERDKILPVGMTRDLYTRLACEKDLVVLEGAGHMLPVEYLEQTVPLVSEWLKKHLMVPEAAPDALPSGDGKAAGDAGKAAAPARKRGASSRAKKN